VADRIIELGYEAALTALAQQDETLGNFRGRATSILSATTVATSLAAGVGLLNTDRTKGSVIPVWAALAILVLAVAIGVAALFVLWPVKDWTYGPEPLDYLPARRAPGDLDAFLGTAVTSLREDYDANSPRLECRAGALRLAVGLLVLEMAAVVATAAFSGR
jgi:hypothetical protein